MLRPKYPSDAPEKKAEYNKRWYKSHYQKQLPRPCIDCGELIQPMSRNAKRCQFCRVIDRANKQRIIQAEHIAKRRCENFASYMRRFRKMHREKESCAICGKIYDITHCLDHIRALAICRLLGISGADDWSNLQPICIKCHRKKTNSDIVTIFQLKRVSLKSLEEVS